MVQILSVIKLVKNNAGLIAIALLMLAIGTLSALLWLSHNTLEKTIMQNDLEREKMTTRIDNLAEANESLDLAIGHLRHAKEVEATIIEDLGNKVDSITVKHARANARIAQLEKENEEVSQALSRLVPRELGCVLEPQYCEGNGVPERSGVPRAE